MARHRIIGIHGLNNKPERAELSRWWQSAIAEGLSRNRGHTDSLVDFELVYWADVVHPKPLDADPEPYLAASGTGPLPRHAPSMSDTAREMAQGAIDKLTAAPKADHVTTALMSSRVPDLHRYNTDSAVRGELRRRLTNAMFRAQSDGCRIMIIAHSMGSIVAFDVLAAMTRAANGPRIQHFITVGSPLGLHEVKQKARDQGLALRVPEVAEHWTNHADRRDSIAFDSRLATDYASNASGTTVADALVINGYVSPAGKANPHKIYGYLRTPEMAEVVHAFATR